MYPTRIEAVPQDGLTHTPFLTLGQAPAMGQQVVPDMIEEGPFGIRDSSY